MEELTSTVKQNAENARQANQLAAGASEVAVRGGAVVGQVMRALETVNRNLGEIVAQVRASSDSVSLAATEITAGNTNLSERTEAQATSLEETASSIEQLTATVKQNADSAGKASELAGNTTSAGLSDVLRVLAALAKGDLTETVTADYRGTLAPDEN